MNVRLNKIASLAEGIAEENISNGKVDLKGIAEKKDISIIYGNYKDAFSGELVHESGRFYIHLNLDELETKNSPRANFTLGHEFGHFFIDEHRNLLLKGESLSHTISREKLVLNNTEKEANHFASNLLMPKNRFVSAANQNEYGIEAILTLKDQFGTSIECTAIHYIDMNIFPAIFIKWDENLNFSRFSYNNKFSELASINGIPKIRIEAGYLREIIKEINNVKPKNDYIENATLLSRWIASVKPQSKFDLVGLEQTFKWGKFGAFTFLLFP